MKKFLNYVDGLVLNALVSVKPQRRVDTTLQTQQLVSLQDVPRANIMDAIYKQYCMHEATLSITSLFFFLSSHLEILALGVQFVYTCTPVLVVMCPS